MERTDSYNDAVTSGIDSTVFDAVFGFIPDGLKENAVITVSNLLANTSTVQANNGITGMGGRWASLEGRGNKSRIKLDGTWESPTDSDTRQVGAWVDNLCDDDGNWETGSEPWILQTFDTTYNIIGATIYFDDLGNEWATSLTLQIFDEDGDEISSTTVSNDSAVAAIGLTAEGAKSAKLTVHSWNVGKRQAKFAQVDGGLVFVFNGDNVYSFTLTEKISPFSTTQFPTAKLEFDNSDAKFDPVNPQGLVSYLEEGGMTVDTGITVAGERIGTSNWPLSEWNEESNDETGYFEMQPWLAIKSGYYPTYVDTGSWTVAEAAAVILEDETYTIDDDVADTVVNKYIGENVSWQNAMSYLALACGAYWIFGRDHTYTLKKWQAVTDAECYKDFDNQFAKPTFSRSSSAVTGVTVNYYTPTESDYTDSGMTMSMTDYTYGDETGTLQSISSPFIRTETQAEAVAEMAMAYYAQRVSMSVSVQGDPAIEPMQGVEIQYNYGDMTVTMEEIGLTYTGTNITETSMKGVG